jgi:hypothetical protein
VETSPGDYRIPWFSLAALAVDTWGRGSDRGEFGATHSSFILPPLTRYQAITLRLPRYQVAMLQELAKRPELGGINRIVSDALVTVAEEYATRWKRRSQALLKRFTSRNAHGRVHTPRALMSPLIIVDDAGA